MLGKKGVEEVIEPFQHRRTSMELFHSLCLINTLAPLAFAQQGNATLGVSRNEVDVILSPCDGIGPPPTPKLDGSQGQQALLCLLNRPLSAYCLKPVADVR